MPQSIVAPCGMVILLCNTVSSHSQPPPFRQTHFINQQLQQQKYWQLKQVQKYSVLYQTALKIPDTYVISKPAPVYYHQPGWKGISTKPAAVMQPVQNHELNSLQHFIRQDRNLYLQGLKNSWWKDPSKGIGASILQGFVNDSYPARKL